MSTDKNQFDDWLKQNLVRDLVFRALVWLIISIIAAYFAIHTLNIPPLDYLDRMGKSLGRLVNSLGSVSILLCLPALMFKDLEAIVKNPRRKAFMGGCFAGAVRRLAGDLSLWTLGAIITLSSSFLLVATIVELKSSDYLPLGVFTATAVMMIAGIGTINFFVRRSAPTPLTTCTNNPLALSVVYGIATALLVFIVVKQL
ncbi:hypothetical protein B1219_19565 [Pseudomonas ogarae]|uniref:hypothetical protein n=1 Tax=Pseudomonas ogarae (strain DSM 112162 / CECT 30235 / F113) TaxID=1114970 RepID=UPI0009A37D14|nr:hypothetical protein [Pseudomonas ogarae]OPG72329.1 hypothetical protein B1219_19565 [Pseudomonas ogarae]OPG79426.1 hypothetical protein B1218_10355 [Pseudomonas ogarae]PBJ03454.1 hypothetical protein BSF43_45230 [Pseudomonas ogarae]PBJ22010.1 hypothetical protein BSG18_27380 [Pseudomonas ogarae]